MNLKDLAHLVSKSAPLLGGVIAGPAGSTVTTLIAAKFGGDANNPDQLVAQILGDPQAAMKLMQIQASNESDLQHMLMLMAENQLKLAVVEKASEGKKPLHENEFKKVNATKNPDKTAAYLAYILTLGTFLILAYLFFNPIPAENRDLIIGIVSALTTVWISAMAYYHGSSANSLLRDMTQLSVKNSEMPIEKIPTKVTVKSPA